MKLWAWPLCKLCGLNSFDLSANHTCVLTRAGLPELGARALIFCGPYIDVETTKFLFSCYLAIKKFGNFVARL